MLQQRNTVRVVQNGGRNTMEIVCQLIILMR